MELPFIFFAFISAFLITYFVIPKLIEIAQRLAIFDKPNERSSHTQSTPFLGGVGILLGVLLSFSFFINIATFPKFCNGVIILKVFGNV